MFDAEWLVWVFLGLEVAQALWIAVREFIPILTLILVWRLLGKR